MGPHVEFSILGCRFGLSGGSAAGRASRELHPAPCVSGGCYAQTSRICNPEQQTRAGAGDLAGTFRLASAVLLWRRAATLSLDQLLLSDARALGITLRVPPKQGCPRRCMKRAPSGGGRRMRTPWPLRRSVRECRRVCCRWTAVSEWLHFRRFSEGEHSCCRWTAISEWLHFILLYSSVNTEEYSRMECGQTGNRHQNSTSWDGFSRAPRRP